MGEIRGAANCNSFVFTDKHCSSLLKIRLVEQSFIGGLPTPLIAALLARMTQHDLGNYISLCVNVFICEVG